MRRMHPTGYTGPPQILQMHPLVMWAPQVLQILVIQGPPYPRRVSDAEPALRGWGMGWGGGWGRWGLVGGGMEPVS